MADSKEWWPQPVKAPKGAPNVVLILLDELKELKVLFDDETVKNNVYPFIDIDDVIHRRIHNPLITPSLIQTK